MDKASKTDRSAGLDVSLQSLGLTVVRTLFHTRKFAEFIELAERYPQLEQYLESPYMWSLWLSVPPAEVVARSSAVITQYYPWKTGLLRHFPSIGSAFRDAVSRDQKMRLFTSLSRAKWFECEYVHPGKLYVKILESQPILCARASSGIMMKPASSKWSMKLVFPNVGADFNIGEYVLIRHEKPNENVYSESIGLVKCGSAESMHKNICEPGVIGDGCTLVYNSTSEGSTLKYYVVPLVPGAYTM